MYQEIKLNFDDLQPGTKAYRRGACRILISPPCGKCGWHMSISCSNRNPRWNEIRDAWYDLVPDAATRCGAMFFPPKHEYVNVYDFCFHIHEVNPDLKHNFSLV